MYGPTGTASRLLCVPTGVHDDPHTYMDDVRFLKYTLHNESQTTQEHLMQSPSLA